MLAVSKDKTQYMSVAVFNSDWYNIYDPELVGKIISYYPTFDWVLDDDGEPIDVTYTGEEPEPSIDEKVAILQEENQLLTDCILEMSEIIYGGE